MGKPLTRHRMVGLGSPSASHNRMTLVPVLYTPLCGFFTQRGGSGNKGKGGAVRGVAQAGRPANAAACASKTLQQVADTAGLPGSVLRASCKEVHLCECARACVNACVGVSVHVHTHTCVHVFSLGL